jgi:CRISPR/Cas system-associated endonuclease Cas3-HD
MKKAKNQIQKDRTMYMMNGYFFNKNGLAHEMVSTIIKRYDWKKLNELVEKENVWNESYLMVAPISLAKQKSEKYKRYFLNAEDLLTDKNGKKIAVCNQWSINNLPGFIKWFSSKYNVQIVKVKQSKNRG